MRAWRSSIVGVGALVCASVAVGASPPVAAQDPGITRAVLDADADASVVQEGHATFTDLQLVDGGTEVTFRLAPDFSEYTVTFAAPRGEQLGVGTYEGAMRPVERSAGRPGLELFGHGRACAHVSGRFVIDELTRDGSGALTTFAARFEQHCENWAPAEFGTIQYRAATVFPQRTVSSNALGFRAVPDDVTPSTDVSIVNPGPTVLTPSTPTLEGMDAAQFRITSSSCGRPLAPGAQCTVSVAFAPTGEPGRRDAAVRFTDELAPPSGSGRRILVRGVVLPDSYPVGYGMENPAVVESPLGDFLFTTGYLGQEIVLQRVGDDWPDALLLGGLLHGPAVPAVPAAGRTEVEVVGVGLDGALWWNSLRDLDTATGWRSLGGRITSIPAAAQLGDATYAFGVGLDGALWYQRVGGAAPLGWTSLGGIVTADPTVLVEGGRLHVLVVGHDRQVWERTLVGGAWSPWTSRGGFVTSSPTGLSGAAAGYLFALGRDGDVWFQRVSGGSWSSWQPLGGRSPARIATTWRDGEPMVAVIGVDRAVWIRRMAGGAWQPWERLGGLTYSSIVAIHRDEVLAQDRDGDLIAHFVPY